MISFFKPNRKYKPAEIKIRCGEWDISDDIEERYDIQERDVDVVSIHPLYTEGRKNNLRLYHDVALVHTTEEFEIAPNVNTMCLPNSVNEDNFSEKNCHTMGWGTLKENDTQAVEIESYMKKVILNRVDNDKCQDIIRSRDETPNNFKLHASFMCAGGREGEDVCRGDGGGPLVCQQQGDTQR